MFNPVQPIAVTLAVYLAGAQQELELRLLEPRAPLGCNGETMVMVKWCISEMVN